MHEEALALLQTVDTTYRESGRYWDHVSWGGHDWRAQAVWCMLNAMLGLTINRDTYTFKPNIAQDSFKVFFAATTGTANFTKSENRATLTLLTGHIEMSKLVLESIFSRKPTALLNGAAVGHELVWGKGKAAITFAEKLRLTEGDILSVVANK